MPGPGGRGWGMVEATTEPPFGGITVAEQTRALADAAAMAGRAPSVHNTQPWRWTVLPDRLELMLDRDRQLVAADPQGRLAVVSCGAALHHARVALAAEGFEAVIRRLPDPERPDLLAVVHV